MVTHDQEEALTMADRIVVMNHGVIEQVGTPDEIYRRPATAFVADFVGKMNFLHGRVTGPGRIDIGGVEVRCDDTAAAPGTSVALGLRPEEVRVRDVSPSDPNALPVEVGELEFMGAFCRARLHPEGARAPLIADFSANLMRDMAIVPGQRITVALPPEALRVFPGDAEGAGTADEAAA